MIHERPVNQTWPLLDRWRLKSTRKKWIKERRHAEFYLYANGYVEQGNEFRLENIRLGVWN